MCLAMLCIKNGILPRLLDFDICELESVTVSSYNVFDWPCVMAVPALALPFTATCQSHANESASETIYGHVRPPEFSFCKMLVLCRFPHQL
eukprot:2669609-Amphidinium_carterae.1